MRTVFINARIITPFRTMTGSVVIDGDAISEVNSGNPTILSPDDKIIDANGLYLSPGFIESLVHGAGNSDVMDGSVEAVCHVCRTHMEYGVTAITPSTMCSTDEELFSTCHDIAEASKIKDRMPEILGVHLEGPFISPNQGGAQDSKYIRKLELTEIERILDNCPNIKIWTIAPELPGALDAANWLKKRGVIASIGHSDAGYDDVTAAVEHGYLLVTHLFNGMSRLHRVNSMFQLGVAESALCQNGLIVQVIADGKHVPPNLLKLVYKIKGPMEICLVTDAIRAAGIETNESIIGSLKTGQKVEVEDGVAYMPGRQSFGGSVSTADRLIRTMYKLVNIPLHEAVSMMTVVPSRLLRVDDRIGSISPGKDADILLFDDDIRIKFVMNKGAIFIDRTQS